MHHMPHAAARVAHVAGIPWDHEHGPGNTGNESKIAKQRSLAQTHSALGTFRNGEVTEGSWPAVYELAGQRWSQGRIKPKAGVDTGRERRCSHFLSRKHPSTQATSPRHGDCAFSAH